MKNVYLILAILGAIVPYVFFAQFFAEAGFDAVGLLLAGSLLHCSSWYSY